MSAARLYILCGLPFAGKTTLALALVQWFGFTHIALDDINSERDLGLTGDAISQSDWARSYAEAHRRLDAALAGGQSVIYDATNFNRKERDRLHKIAARYNISTTVIYLDLADEARHRWQANRRTRSRYDVRDEDFAQVADNFDPPTADEDTLTYDGSLPLDEWVAQTFEDAK